MQGKQKQQKRTTTFFEFNNAASGTLLCTDVAARGLDIPKVDWIVQYDPPDDPRDYIHRVGRTARAGKVGKSLLFLLESELGFLRYLKEAKVPLNEFTFPKERIANVQSQVCSFRWAVWGHMKVDGLRKLEKLLQKNFFLHQSAKDGFRSYLQAYASYSHKKIFDVNQLDLVKVGKAFGFAVPPRVSLNIAGGANNTSSSEGKKGKKRKRAAAADEEGEEQEGEWLDMEDARNGAGEEEADEVVEEDTRRGSRGQGKQRRIETLGRKKVQKEFYKKGMVKGHGGPSWSR